MSITATATVTVSGSNVTVSTVALAPTSLSLNPGLSPSTLVATAYNSSGVQLSGKAFTASSSDPTKATVSIAGAVLTVTPAADGSTNVTATSETVTSNACVVTVADPASGFFVSPSGLASGSGGFANPFSMTYAVSGAGGLITPGATVWVRGGVYTGPFAPSGVAGSAGNYVTFRNYNGEHAIVDAAFLPTGDYVAWWGLEFHNTSGQRVSAQAGSDPTDIPGTYHVTVRALGNYNRFINCRMHEHANGIGDGDAILGTEWNGCTVFNSGWEGTDRGHGHWAYIQNNTPAKNLTDCVFWGSFDIGGQFGGTSSARAKNLVLTGCAVLGSDGFVGSFPTHNAQEWYGGEDFGDQGFGPVTMTYCSFYEPPGAAGTLKVGVLGEIGGTGATIQNCTLHGYPPIELNENKQANIQNNKITTGSMALSGGSKLMIARVPNDGTLLSSHTIDNNTYACPSFGGGNGFISTVGGVNTGYTSLAAWRAGTGYDTNSTLTFGQFTGSDTVVRSSSYEPGRGIIHVWNWDSAASLNLDLSGILTNGDSYVLHHIYDTYGTPVASGVYGGGTVAVAQTGYTPPKPTGYATTPTSASPILNVFLVRKVTVTTTPTAPSGLAAVASGSSTINLTWTDNSSNELGFLAERQQGSDWVPAQIAPANATSMSVTGLTSSTSYTFRLRAYSEAGQSAASATATATTGAPSGTVFVNDTFTGSAATTLASHTGETGATWIRHPSYSASAEITDANRLRPSTTSASAYYASGVPATPDYDVQGVFTIFSTTNSDAPGVCGRMDTTTNKFYMARYNAGAGRWELFRFDPVGGNVTIGFFTQAVTIGADYTVLLSMRGTSINLWLNGVLRISATDTVVTAAGRAGLRLSSQATVGNAVGIHLDTLTATAP